MPPVRTSTGSIRSATPSIRDNLCIVKTARHFDLAELGQVGYAFLARSFTPVRLRTRFSGETPSGGL